MRGLNNIIDLNAERNFWINDIALFVPPTSISVHKEGLDYSIKALRTRVSTKILSGNGIYHAQVNLTFPPDGLIQLHRLICQIRNNPFLYIENDFIRSSIDGRESYCYFTLMGLNIINHPSSPGSFNVELDLRYFNHKVYDPNLGYFQDWGYEILDAGKIKKISFSPTLPNDQEGDVGVVIEEVESEENSAQSIRAIENFASRENEIEAFATRKVKSPKDSLVYKRYSNYLQNAYLEENFGIILSNYLEDKKALKQDINKGTYGIHETKSQDLIKLRDYLIGEIFKRSNLTKFSFRNFAVIKITPTLAKKIKTRIDENITASMTEEAKISTRRNNFKKLGEDISKLNADTTKVNEGNIEGNYNDYKFKGVSLQDRDITWFRNNSSFSEAYYPLTDSPIYTKINDNRLKFNSTRKLDNQNSVYPVFASQDNITISYLDFNKKIIVFKEGIQYSGLALFNKLRVDFTLNKGDLVGYIESGQDVEYLNPSKEVIEYYLNNYEKIDNNVTIRGDFETSDLQELRNLKEYIDENYNLYTGVSGLENVLESTLTYSMPEFSKEDISLILGIDPNTLDKEIIDEDYKGGTSSAVVAISGSLRNIVTSIPILGQEFPTHQFLGSIEPSYQINIIGKKIIDDQLPDAIEFIERGRTNSQFYSKNFAAIPDAGNFLVECLLTKLLGSYKQNSILFLESTKPSDKTVVPIIQHNFIVNSCDTFSIEGSPKAVGFNFRFSETKSYREENLRAIASNTLPENYKRKVLEILENTQIVNIQNPKLNNEIQTETPTLNEKNNWSMLNWKTKYFSSHKWYSKGKVSSLYKDGSLLTSMNSNQENDDMNQDYNSYLLASEILDKIQDLLNDYDSPINPKAEKAFTLTFSSTFDIKGSGTRQTISNHFHGSAADIRVSNMNAMELAAIIEILMEEGYLKNPKLSEKIGLGNLGVGIYGKNANDENTLMDPASKVTGFIHIDLNASLKDINHNTGVASINNEYKFLGFKYSKRRWLGESGDDQFQGIVASFWESDIVEIKNRIRENVISALRKESTPIPKDSYTPSFQWVKLPASEIKTNSGILSYSYTQLSNEFQQKYMNVFDKVKALGGVLTSGGGRRPLSTLTKKSSSGRARLGMHNIGRAIDLAPYSGLAGKFEDDPNIKYLVIKDEPSNPNSLFTVWCEVNKEQDGFDQETFDQAVAEDLVKENHTFEVDLIRNSKEQSTYSWTGTAFNLTQIMLDEGFTRIKPIDDYLTQGKFAGIEWWHYEIHEGLVASKTTGLDEMLKLYTYKEASESHPYFEEASRLVWNGGIFA